MLARASRSICTRARQRGYFSRTLNNNPHLSCSSAPLILSMRKHDKQGLLLILSRKVPVSCACARLSLSPRTSTTNGVFFLFSQEALLSAVLAHTSRSLCAKARQTESSHCHGHFLTHNCLLMFPSRPSSLPYILSLFSSPHQFNIST